MPSFTRTFSHSPWEKTIGYCRALRAGDHIYVTGTAPVADDGNTYAPGDAYRQAVHCLALIERALAQLQASRRDIVRTRMFVTDMERWPDFGRAHQEFFADAVPASTIVQVSRLIAPEMLIEIEADAYLQAAQPASGT